VPPAVPDGVPVVPVVAAPVEVVAEVPVVVVPAVPVVVVVPVLVPAVPVVAGAAPAVDAVPVVAVPAVLVPPLDPVAEGALELGAGVETIVTDEPLAVLTVIGEEALGDCPPPDPPTAQTNQCLPAFSKAASGAPSPVANRCSGGDPGFRGNIDEKECRTSVALGTTLIPRTARIFASTNTKLSDTPSAFDTIGISSFQEVTAGEVGRASPRNVDTLS